MSLKKYLMIGLTTSIGLITSAFATEPCNLIRESNFAHTEIGTVPIFRDKNTKAVIFTSQMQVNTDGAPDSYHPDNIGLTHICNGVSLKVGNDCVWKKDCLPDFSKAKAEGFSGPTKFCFFAMATDNKGKPIIQGEGDPKPGYFVSTTALQQPGVDPKTAQAQLDSHLIPFIVIPTSWQKSEAPGLKLGDFAVVLRKSNGKMSYAVVGDLGPRNKLGEGSLALHEALGNDPIVKKSGVSRAMRGIGGRDVIYIVFPNSRKPGEKITKELIDKETAELFEKFGGKEKLMACVK